MAEGIFTRDLIMVGKPQHLVMAMVRLGEMPKFWWKKGGINPTYGNRMGYSPSWCEWLGLSKYSVFFYHSFSSWLLMRQNDDPPTPLTPLDLGVPHVAPTASDLHRWGAFPWQEWELVPGVDGPTVIDPVGRSLTAKQLLNMAIEIEDLPMKNCDVP